jgi:hypothetical protein
MLKPIGKNFELNEKFKNESIKAYILKIRERV